MTDGYLDDRMHQIQHTKERKMCNYHQSPPYGIPIPAEIHDEFPEEVKKAWETFHQWWVENFDGCSVRRSSMPEDVKNAFQIMQNAKIPRYDGATGADSCYVMGVNRYLID